MPKTKEAPSARHVIRRTLHSAAGNANKKTKGREGGRKEGRFGSIIWSTDLILDPADLPRPLPKRMKTYSHMDLCILYDSKNLEKVQVNIMNEQYQS